MTITPAQLDKIKQRTYLGEERLTALLNTSGQVDVQEFSCPAQSISYQADGTLQCSVAVSCNGTNFVSATAVTDNTIKNYNASLVKQVQVTYTSGSGRLVILAR